jgi:hypothetical protein
MIRKKTFQMAKTQNLIRLAKWLEIDVTGLSHYEIAENIYFHLLYL